MNVFKQPFCLNPLEKVNVFQNIQKKKKIQAGSKPGTTSWTAGQRVNSTQELGTQMTPRGLLLEKQHTRSAHTC